MGTVFPACILYGPMECPFKLRIGFTLEENINMTGNFLTNGKPFRAFGLLSHITSTIVSHHIAEEPNTKLSTHLVQTSAKTRVSFVCFSKPSLLKSSYSNSNKSLLIKVKQQYQIIYTVQNCCLAFILSIKDTILGQIS